MNNRTLSLLAATGAPFLCFGLLLETYVPSVFNGWFKGFWGIVYMVGWTASLALIHRSRLLQPYAFSRVVLSILFFTLAVANVSNVIVMVSPTAMPPYFFYLDICWPLSNVLMLVLALSVIRKRDLPAAFRRTLLFVGFWLPLNLPLMMLYRTPLTLVTGCVYSLIAWSLLARQTAKLDVAVRTAVPAAA